MSNVKLVKEEEEEFDPDKFLESISQAQTGGLVLASWWKVACENGPTEIWFSAPNTLPSCYSGAT